MEDEEVEGASQVTRNEFDIHNPSTHTHTHTHIHPKNVFLRAVQSLFISRKNHEMSQYCGAKGDGDEKEETLLLLLVYFRWLIFFYFILEQQLRVE
jgi:hypothetical protein